MQGVVEHRDEIVVFVVGPGNSLASIHLLAPFCSLSACHIRRTQVRHRTNEPGIGQMINLTT